jgi:hypothetical protein
MKVNFIFKNSIDVFEKHSNMGTPQIKPNKMKYLDIGHTQGQNNNQNLNISKISHNGNQFESNRESSFKSTCKNYSNCNDIKLEFTYIKKEDEEKVTHNGIILKDCHRIVDLKLLLSMQNKFKIDSIELFTYPMNLDKIKRIYDDEMLEDFINNFNFSSLILSPNLKKNQDSNCSIINSPKNSTPKTYYLYYKLDLKPIKVNLEYHQNNIDNLIYELTTSCQIYMLKYLINKKLKELPINEQNITILGISDPDKPFDSNRSDNSEIKNSTPIEIKDRMTIDDIIKLLNDKNNINYKCLHLFLARKGEIKCTIGIDFSFALLKNLKKIEFENLAPSHREASDGINIFCYCKNSNCGLYNEMFIEPLGFGKFDIVREIESLTCPRCNYDKYIKAMNLGFIHCEWSYKGIMSNKNNSIITGDGFTTDDKLYVMNEIDLIENIDGLEIYVKEIYHESKIGDNLTYNNETVSSFDDSDIQFSVRNKYLFKNAVDLNAKNFQNFYKNRSIKKNNYSKYKSNNSNNSGSELNHKMEKDFNKPGKIDCSEIKLDNKKNMTCCDPYFKNNFNDKICVIY